MNSVSVFNSKRGQEQNSRYWQNPGGSEIYMYMSKPLFYVVHDINPKKPILENCDRVHRASKKIIKGH